MFFNGALYIYKWNLSIIPCFPKYLQSWRQALNRTAIWKYPTSNYGTDVPTKHKWLGTDIHDTIR